MEGWLISDRTFSTRQQVLTYLAQVGDGRVGKTEDTINRVVSERRREGGDGGEVLAGHTEPGNRD